MNLKKELLWGLWVVFRVQVGYDLSWWCEALSIRSRTMPRLQRLYGFLGCEIVVPVTRPLHASSPNPKVQNSPKALYSMVFGPKSLKI